MKISDIGEFALIAQIAQKFQDLIPDRCKGIGDDCAIIPISDTESIVVTTDMLVEDVHFLIDKITPYELGYKALAVNLSDIAAMGAMPHSTFLSIALPSDISTSWCEDFFSGYREHQVPLLGGDTTKSLMGKVIINIMAIGKIHNENIKLRSGAQVGDQIYVTSTLGDSAGGLHSILHSRESEFASLVKQHNTPRPHLAEGLALGTESQVTAMMDISDGLSSDLLHILNASQVGAIIDLQQIPISSELLATPWNTRELALNGGEDFCLLFTATTDFVPPSVFMFHQIGEIVAEPIGEIIWMEQGEIKPIEYRGYRHF